MTSLGRIDFRLAHQLPRKPAKGHTPHCPLISIVEISIPQLEQSLLGPWGKFVGRSVSE